MQLCLLACVSSTALWGVERCVGWWVWLFGALLGPEGTPVGWCALGGPGLLRRYTAYA
jgi:hypothetical protein